MDEIYVYIVPLPDKVHEAVTPCIDGYTIYLNLKDDEIRQEKALRHAMKHIENGDFERTDDVQEIESEAHK